MFYFILFYHKSNLFEPTMIDRIVSQKHFQSNRYVCTYAVHTTNSMSLLMHWDFEGQHTHLHVGIFETTSVLHHKRAR